MTDQYDWWHSFYAGSYVDFHRDVLKRKQSPAEVDQMQKLLSLAAPARLLDLGCGEGRHAIEFAARGFEVTGIDITLPLLDVAREEASRRQLTITFNRSDMRDLPQKSAFDAAYCVWGSFGLFDEAGNRELVQAVFRTLKPGGKFLLENHIVETLLPRFWRNGWDHIGDNLIRLEERRFDHVTSRLESSWQYVHLPDGPIETEKMSMRIYTYHELCELLKAAGFINFEGYDTVTGTPFVFGAERLSLVATKPNRVD